MLEDSILIALAITDIRLPGKTNVLPDRPGRMRIAAPGVDCAMYFGGGVFLRSRWWLPYSLTPWGGVRMDGARRSAELKQSPGGSQSPGLLFSPHPLMHGERGRDGINASAMNHSD